MGNISQKEERSKAERNSARQEANAAQEETARWHGQAEALQSQNIALVQRFTPNEEAATTTPEKPASKRGKKEI